jgi:hypothetical protein
MPRFPHLVQRANAFRLQFRHFLGACPHHRPARVVSLQHQLKSALFRVPQCLREGFYNKLEGVVIIVFDDDIVWRNSPRARFMFVFGPRDYLLFEQIRLSAHGRFSLREAMVFNILATRWTGIQVKRKRAASTAARPLAVARRHTLLHCDYTCTKAIGEFRKRRLPLLALRAGRLLSESVMTELKK